MKKLFVGLLSLLLSISPIKSQTKLEANKNYLDLKSKYAQIYLQNKNDLTDYLNTTGKIRLGTINNNLFFNREGFLNNSFGGNLGFEGFNTFYTNRRQNIRNRNEKGNIISEILEENRNQEFGLRAGPEDINFSYEMATSKQNLDGKIILFFGEDKEISKFEENLTKTSSMWAINSKYFYFKEIENEIQFKDEVSKDKKNIISLNLKYLNYITNWSKSYGYLSSNTSPINLFLFSDSSLVIETDDYSELEKYRFHREIENKNRIVPRIYDSFYETSLDYLRDMFFTDRKMSFRLRFKPKEEPDLETRVNFKYLIGKTDFDKSHSLAIISPILLKNRYIFKPFLGYSTTSKQAYFGFSLNEK